MISGMLVLILLSFWEKKLELQSQLPVDTRVRLFHIVICTNMTV